MSIKRKRIRVKVSELLKKIESKSSEPKHISEIIPEAVDAMAGGRNIHEGLQDLARLELEMEVKSVEEYRTTKDSIVPNPKFGSMIYCGTGGAVDHEAKRIFENPNNK